VVPDVLYRSGQMDRAGLERFVYDYGIRTVITLREESKSVDKAMAWEQAFCAENGIKFVQIPPARWWVDDGPPPAREGVERFLAIMRDPEKYPRPVLIHCFAGQHRSGAYCAIYRMEFQGWTADEALEEMRQLGYDRIDEELDVRTFIRSYVPTGKSGQ
jgi:tyrosine-protein phosphatase SIW14